MFITMPIITLVLFAAFIYAICIMASTSIKDEEKMKPYYYEEIIASRNPYNITK